MAGFPLGAQAQQQRHQAFYGEIEIRSIR